MNKEITNVIIEKINPRYLIKLSLLFSANKSKIPPANGINNK
jgi:hypothetical protein